MKKILLCVGMAFLMGCASGFDRGKIKEGIYGQELQITNEEIRKIQELKPQIKFPIKVAVVLISGFKDRWVEQNKKEVLSWGENLKKEGVVSDFFFLPTMMTGGRPTVKDLRVASARLGADVLLVLGSSVQTDGYANPAAFFYITIVGMFFVPGTHIDSLCLMEGILFDVNNEYIYLTVEAEGKGSTWGPLVFTYEETATTRAKENAIKAIGPEFIQRMKNLKGK